MATAVIAEQTRLLLAACRHDEPDAEQRFFAALFYAIELVTEGDRHYAAGARAIASGELALEGVMRQRARDAATIELEQSLLADDARLASKLVDAHAQWPDELPHFEAGDVIVALPSGSQLAADRPPAGPANSTSERFRAPGDRRPIHELYVAWAARQGWRIDLEAEGYFKMYSGDRIIEITLVPAPGRDTYVTIRIVARNPTGKFVAGRARRPAPVLPRATRAQPPRGEPVALRRPSSLVCDRGVLLAATADGLVAIDPATREIRKLAADDGTFASSAPLARTALALDGDALWVALADARAIRQVDLDAARTVTAIDGVRATELALADGMLYAASATTIIAIDPRTREHRAIAQNIVTLIAGLAVGGATLYVAKAERMRGDAVVAIDRASGEVVPVAKVPAPIRSLVCDGKVIYAGLVGGIVRVGLDGTIESLAGAKGFAPGMRDGGSADASIGIARGLALDGTGGLYFLDDGALRRLDLERREVDTIVAAVSG
ncbi:MAG TPA: hypothetical protein VMJ10_14655 [Kofleriaceae bacterium]|nr:hypothetical protein [Kofleriaceae bacterium]